MDTPPNLPLPPGSADSPQPDRPPTASALRSLPSLVAAGVLVLVLLLYMFSFVVRHGEAVVLTTFQKAEESSIYRDAGWYFKWPWPVQSVTRYDVRQRSYRPPIYQIKTRPGDDKTITISFSAIWNVSDPLVFFRRVSTVDEAEKKLSSILNSESQAVLGRRALHELVNSDGARMQMADIEQEILAGVKRTLDSDQGRIGIDLRTVSFRVLSAPQNVTESIHRQMTSDQQQKAQAFVAQGEAAAKGIRNEAERQAAIIEQFANELAENIRSEGRVAAAQWAGVLEQAPEFASLIMSLDFATAALDDMTTYVLDANSFNGVLAPLVRNARGDAVTPTAPLNPAQRPADAPALSGATGQ